MEYTIESKCGTWKEELDNISEKIIEMMAENKLSILDVQNLFDNIMWKLTTNMPISTDKIESY